MNSPFLKLLAAGLLIVGGCSGSRGNASPTLSVLEPSSDVLMAPGPMVQLDYVDDDRDDIALTSLYADLDGDLATTNDQIPIDLDRPDGDGSLQTVMWDTTGVASGIYTILAVTDDGSNTAVSASATGVVTINVPPTVSVTDPTSNVRRDTGSMVRLNYVDNDPDNDAVTDLLADADGDLSTASDQYVIATGRPEQDGTAQIVDWDTVGVPPGSYAILAVTSDGIYAPVRTSSAGRVTLADTVFDDFEDGIVDTALWEVLQPFPSSNATESSGTLNLSLRPYITTVDEWIPSAVVPLVVEFDWTVASSVSHLNLLTRSDATWFGSFAEAANGVGVNLSVQGGLIWGYTVVDTVAGGVPGIDFGDHPFTFVSGTTYRIRLEDDGSRLRVFINDMTTPLAEGTTAEAFAINRVVFYNRELGSGADRFDNFRISGVRLPR